MKKKHLRLANTGKFLLSLGMVFTMITPSSVLANEEQVKNEEETFVTPSNGEISSPKKDDGTEGSEATPLGYDTTKPVIEDVSMPQNGKTVNPGDNVDLFVQAYDDSKEISAIEVTVEYDSSDEGLRIETYTAYTKTDKENEYKIAIEALDGYATAKVTKVKVYDKAGNFVERTKTDGLVVQFNIVHNDNSGEDIKYEYTIGSIEFKQNHETLERGDRLDLTVTLTGEHLDAVERIDMHFDNRAGTDLWSTASFTLSRKSDGVYSGYTYLHSKNHNGEYKLSPQVELRGSFSGSSYLPIQCENTSAYNFYVVGEEDIEFPVITSIEMDKESGAIVEPGDKVTFKIKVTDNVGVKKENAYLYVKPVARIDSPYNNVSLVYNEEEGAFIGSFYVFDSTYPTEWFIESIQIYDTSDNLVKVKEYDPDFYETYPYYFNVKNKDTFVTAKYDIKVNCFSLTEEGYYKSINETNLKNVERRTTLKDAGLELPKVESVKGLNFIGWQTADGKTFDINTPIVNSVTDINLYAKYDKTYATINYAYPNKNGKNTFHKAEFKLENGSTYRDLLEKENEFMPSDLDTTYAFTGWESHYDSDLDKVLMNGNGIALYASFGDKVFVERSYSYYNTDARNKLDYEIVYVDRGTDKSEVMKDAVTKSAPNSFEGLRFKNWKYYEHNGETMNGDTFYSFAEYENYMIRFAVNEKSKSNDNKTTRGAAGIDDSLFDVIIGLAVEPGESFTVPEIPNYKNVVWSDPKPEGENLIASYDRTFYGVGNKEGSDSSDNNDNNNNNDNNDNDSNGGNDSSNNDGNNGQETNNGIKLPDTVIINTIQSIENANAGEKIEVDMGNATVVPVDVLAAAKGKDVVVVLHMDGYSWTINGKDILASNLKDINLEVKMNTQAIPSKTVQALAGDNPTKQLSLTHNGDFGFKASLSLNLGSEYNGKYGNLYYYDSDGVLKFMNAGKIGADGNVSLEFSHASDYVIIINDEIMEKPIKDTATGTAQDPLSAMMVFCLLGCGYYVLSKKADSVSDVK